MNTHYRFWHNHLLFFLLSFFFFRSFKSGVEVWILGVWCALLDSWIIQVSEGNLKHSGSISNLLVLGRRQRGRGGLYRAGRGEEMGKEGRCGVCLGSE